MKDLPAWASLIACLPSPTAAEVALAGVILESGSLGHAKLDLRTGEELDDPDWSSLWGAERTISATALTWAISTLRDSKLPRGLFIHGALIKEDIDLSHGRLGFPIGFIQCRLLGELDLGGSTLQSLTLDGSRINRANLHAARVGGDAFFRSGFTCDHSIRLVLAKIDGSLDFGYRTRPGKHLAGDYYPPDIERYRRGARIGIENGYSIQAAQISVRGDFRACHDSRFEGRLNCAGAEVGGQFTIMNSNLGTSKDELALCLDRADVGSLAITRSTISGRVRMTGCKTRSHLEPKHTSIHSTAPREYALDGARLTSSGNIYMQGLTAEGSGGVCLLGCRAVGYLRAHNATLTANSRSQYALDARRAAIDGSVFLCNDFHASGEVRLLNAVIGGKLDLGGGRFTNSAQPVPGSTAPRERVPRALHATGIEVGGTMQMSTSNGSACRCVGQVRLIRAHIHGDLDLSEAELRTTSTEHGLGVDSHVVRADDCTIDGNVYMGRNSTSPLSAEFVERHGPTIVGGVSLIGANIKKGLSILDLNQDSKIPHFDIRYLTCRTLHDSKDAWEHAAHLDMNGFTYARIHHDSKGGRFSLIDRINWLDKARNTGESKKQPAAIDAQPYEQLALTYRADGDRRSAKLTLRHREEHNRCNLPRLSRPAHVLWGWLLGYGYTQTRSLLLCLSFFIAGAGLFAFGVVEGELVPRNGASISQALRESLSRSSGSDTANLSMIQWLELGKVASSYSAEGIVPFVSSTVQLEWDTREDNAFARVFWVFRLVQSILIPLLAFLLFYGMRQLVRP